VAVHESRATRVHEPWDGTSRRIHSSPNATDGHNRLFRVTTRGVGAVIAVGTAGQENGPDNANGIILSG
jgi:hypothetical protein